MNRFEKNQSLESWLIKARKATYHTNPKAPEVIVGKVLKLSKTDLATKAQNISLSTKKIRKLDNLLGRLLAGRPLSAVIGSTDFHGIKLKINSRVLSPRPESEKLVEYVIENVQKSATIFDIGTGSGAIGLAISKARPDLKVILTDISPEALQLAKRNAKLNKLTNIEFINSNLFKKVVQYPSSQSSTVSYFIANLPYVDRRWNNINIKRLSFEPDSALFSNKKGLQIIENFLDELSTRKLLTKINFALIEHDPKQHHSIKDICDKIGFQTKKVSEFVTLIQLKT